MEDDDETQSLQSPFPSSPPILPRSSSRNTLELVVHSSVTGNKNGRGRDDCWSEEATKVLIDAWGDRFREPGKRTLKKEHWIEVAEIVNNRFQFKYPKTDLQCRNRIDTVKKKYNQEKAKIAFSGGSSYWIFFKKLESLIGATSKSTKKVAAPPKGVLVQHKGVKRSSDSKVLSASETESESETLPPLEPPQKRLKMDNTGELVKAVLRFSEAYEKTETAKIKVMVELEKERMKFYKDMELRRILFLKTHLEMLKKNQEEEKRRLGERR